jgi:hypothetical protein
MPDYLLPPDRYDDVRSALDPMLDEEALPTSVIESVVHLGQAEAWAKALDPLWATRTGAELESLLLAITYRTAGIISPYVPHAKQINMAGHTATFNYAETAEQRTARLLTTAFDMLVGYLPELLQVEVVTPFFVTTVSGRRA